MFKSLVDDADANTLIYSDDVDKLDLDAEIRQRFVQLTKSMSNETSKEEFVKRLRCVRLCEYFNHKFTI